MLRVLCARSLRRLNSVYQPKGFYPKATTSMLSGRPKAGIARPKIGRPYVRLGGRSPYTAAARVARVEGAYSQLRGPAMEQHSEVLVGLDVAKARHAVAAAEDGRSGAVKYLGRIDSDPVAVRRMAARLEAPPTIALLL
jgi:hypothetical protein